MNSFFAEAKQWKKQEVTKVQKKIVESETVGWIYFFFISETMCVDACTCICVLLNKYVK